MDVARLQYKYGASLHSQAAGRAGIWYFPNLYPYRWFFRPMRVTQVKGASFVFGLRYCAPCVVWSVLFWG